MEKLTLEHIAPYLPYGLSATTKECGYKLPENGVITSWQGNGNSDEQIVISTGDGYYLSSIEKTVPLLRPMDLTKPVIVEVKEIIPIVELAKLFDPFHEWIIKDNNCVSSQGSFYLWDKDFVFKDHQTKEVLVCTRQRILFKKLYELKFDLDNLIEKGLAIDANTLKNNPYK